MGDLRELAGYRVEGECWNRWAWAVVEGMGVGWLRIRELGVRRGMAEVSILQAGKPVHQEFVVHLPGKRFDNLDSRFVGKAQLRQRLRKVGDMVVVGPAQQL